MKKIKPKKVPLKRIVKRLADKRPGHKLPPEKTLEQAIQNLPRITNETVAEHREEVLSSARKYIYPLKHSARKVVTTSAGLFAVALVMFLAYALLALYRFQSTSTFIYDVAQVVPFPVAKAGPHFISYESYLFELRHYIHYYQTQQKIDFSSESGKQQLQAFRKEALQNVVTDAYVKQLASENHITVTDAEVNDEIALVRSQNRLGSNNQVFADVLKEFWGWSLDDFKRELAKQLLAQKVVSKLDIQTHNRAQNVLNQIQSGADFAGLAAQYSDDAGTKGNGGGYGSPITSSSTDVPPQVVAALTKLSAGQTSGIIDTGSSLEIVKANQINGSQITASHIQFNFQPLNTYTQPLQEKQKVHAFVGL